MKTILIISVIFAAPPAAYYNYCPPVYTPTLSQEIIQIQIEQQQPQRLRHCH